MSPYTYSQYYLYSLKVEGTVDEAMEVTDEFSFQDDSTGLRIPPESPFETGGGGDDEFVVFTAGLAVVTAAAAGGVLEVDIGEAAEAGAV